MSNEIRQVLDIIPGVLAARPDGHVRQFGQFFKQIRAFPHRGAIDVLIEHGTKRTAHYVKLLTPDYVKQR